MAEDEASEQARTAEDHTQGQREVAGNEPPSVKIPASALWQLTPPHARATLAIERAEELERYFAAVRRRLLRTVSNCHSLPETDDSMTPAEIAKAWVEKGGLGRLENETREDIGRTQAAWLALHGSQRDGTPARMTLLKCVFGNAALFHDLPAHDAGTRRRVAKRAAKYFAAEYPDHAERLSLEDWTLALGVTRIGPGRPRRGGESKWTVLRKFVCKAGFTFTGSSETLREDWQKWSANWGG